MTYKEDIEEEISLLERTIEVAKRRTRVGILYIPEGLEYDEDLLYSGGPLIISGPAELEEQVEYIDLTRTQEFIGHYEERLEILRKLLVELEDKSV